MSITAKGEIIIEYLTKFPSTSSHMISRMLAKDIPYMFADEEDARRLVRYYRGASGEKSRSDLSEEYYHPKINVPYSCEEDYSPYILDWDKKPILITSDGHFPYHDQDSIEIMFEYASKKKFGTLILLGDWLDMFMLSKFIKDPRNKQIDEELMMFREFIASIRKAFPKIKIVYKYGNHEERYDNYIMTHAPYLFHLPTTHLESQLNLGEFNIDIVKDKRIIKINQLYVIHGHEYIFNISNPVSPARGLYLRAKKSALCGHFHQTSEHSESSISGKTTSCWTIGGMCAMHPKYMPLNKWNTGFADMESDEDYFRINNRKIINYRVV